MTSIPFTGEQWSAHPKPDTPLNIADDKLVLTTNKGTDWWHTLERNSQDGVVYGFEVDVSKGIEISVELDIAHKDRVSHDPAIRNARLHAKPELMAVVSPVAKDGLRSSELTRPVTRRAYGFSSARISGSRRASSLMDN